MDTAQAEINYKFHAKLISKTDQKLKGRVPMHIRENVVNEIRDVSETNSTKIRSCCSDKGVCSLQISYPQQIYTPSQVAEILAVIDNSRCLLQVTGLTYQLLYTLRLKCSGISTYFNSNVLFSGNIRKIIPPGQSLLNTESVRIRVNLAEKMHQLARTHSVRGKLIDCAYFVKVTAVINEDSCCLSNPSTQSVVTIVPDLIILQNEPQAPPDWNPSVLQRVSVKYDDKNEFLPSAPQNL